MDSQTKCLDVYRELADWYEQRGQAPMRDRFLVLAADAALAAGSGDEAERLRLRLLQLNPHHMLKPYSSFAQALEAPDVSTYVRDLRQNYPPEVAEGLLRMLPAEEDRVSQALPPTAPANGSGRWAPPHCSHCWRPGGRRCARNGRSRHASPGRPRPTSRWSRRRRRGAPTTISSRPTRNCSSPSTPTRASSTSQPWSPALTDEQQETEQGTRLWGGRFAGGPPFRRTHAAQGIRPGGPGGSRPLPRHALPSGRRPTPPPDPPPGSHAAAGV